MKKLIFCLIAGLLLIGANLFAADGDLIVNGNVGIGTTSPSEKLHIQSTAAGNPTLFKISDAAGTTGPLAEISDTVHISTKELLRLTGDSDADAGGPFYTVFKANGNVGIGTTNPGANLHLQAVSGSTALFQAKSAVPSMGTVAEITDTISGTNFLLHLIGDSDGDAGGPYNIVFTKSGNVGIGTPSPSYTLHVNGSAYSTGGWAGSDIKWKKNINPIDNALGSVMKLHGVSYEWRAEEYKDMRFDENKQLGLIAQDVEKVIPELVRSDAKGYKAVSYEKLTAVLVEAIKEQQREIEELRAEIKKIRGIK